MLGREFEFETLLAASRGGEEGLIDSLECATRAQLVEAVGASRDVTFAFTHALIPVTLYEGVSILRRRRLHCRAAEAIEQLHPDDFESLAHHYSEAGDEERALAYHTQAGERASAAYANVEAEGHYRAALELVEIDAERADLLSGLGRMLNRQSKYEEALEVWREGIALYEALGQQDEVAGLYARSARAAHHMGDVPRGLRICREGMAAVERAPESPDYADLVHETARACAFNGLPEEASSLHSQALEMAERMGAVRVQAEALATLALLPEVPYEERVSALTRAVELAESAGLLEQAARAHNNLGDWLIDPEAAREHYLRAGELERQRGGILMRCFYAVRAAQASLTMGDLAEVEEALPSLRQMLDAAEEPSLVSMMLRTLEATLLELRGELSEAIERRQSLQTEAREAGDLQALFGLTAPLALTYIREEVGQEEELEALLQETRDLCEQGMGSTAALSLLLSLQCARRGEPEAARRLLTKAHEQAAEQGESVLWEPWLSWAEAKVALTEGSWSKALAAFVMTVGTMGRRKWRWNRARTLIEWAEAHLARGEPGDRERVGELLREAEAEFEAMGAPIYVERVRGRLEELG